MKRSDDSQKFTLAAIDLDGTLLGPDRKISPANLRAVQRLQDAGLQIALASGRHYHNMRRYAEALPGIEWMVSCQGGESSNIARDVVLNREFLARGDVSTILETARTRDFAAVIYTVDRIFTTSAWNADLEFYSELAGYRPLAISPAELLNRPVFKIIWMGSPSGLEAFSQPESLLPGVQAVRTHERLLEFMPADVTKASGLRRIAARLGLEPQATITFGDGDNDVPMFAWSGVSFAMAHGWPSALRRASHIAPAGSPETAFARGVDYAFQLGLLTARN